MKSRDYSINGDFGQVRLCRSIISPKLNTPFQFKNGGWHKCNELYHIKRTIGLPQYLIFFSVSEGGRVQIGEESFELPASSVTILPPEIPHEYCGMEGAWWEFYWLYYPKDYADVLNQLTEQFGYVFEIPRAVQIGKLLENLLPERFIRDEINYEITVSQTMSQILHMLLEDAYRITEKHQNKNSVVQEIVYEIESRYNQKLNIEELAENHYLSVQHLIRVFKRDTNYTPYEYLKKYRLQKSCELLLSSNFSVSEIAEKTGFQHGNNFIYQFKKEYQMTPGEYRELYTK